LSYTHTLRRDATLRETHNETETQMERETHWETHKQRHCESHREKHTHRDTHTEGEKLKQGERDPHSPNFMTGYIRICAFPQNYIIIYIYIYIYIYIAALHVYFRTLEYLEHD